LAPQYLYITVPYIVNIEEISKYSYFYYKNITIIRQGNCFFAKT